MQFSTTALAGQSIGRGNKEQAFVYRKMSFLLTLGFSVLLGLLMLTLRYPLGKAFSAEEEVRTLTSNNLIIGSVSFVLDGTICSFRGTISAIGLQRYSAIIFFFAFWVFVLPVSAAWVLAFGKGLYYVWGTKVVGSLVVFIGTGLVVLCANYEKILQDSKNRLDKAKKLNTRTD